MVMVKKKKKVKSIKAKKTAKPKKTEVAEVAQVVETKKEVSKAIKQYIFDNMGRMALSEIANHCGLSEPEVEAIAVSAELDISPEDKALGVTPIRRYQKYKGSIAMTPQQSMLDDRVHEHNLPNINEINKQFGKDFEIIKLKKPL